VDVPREAFPEECNEVATAYSAVDLYCLKKLEKKGFLPKTSKASIRWYIALHSMIGAPAHQR
jgi:hypothetical protein